MAAILSRPQCVNPGTNGVTLTIMNECIMWSSNHKQIKAQQNNVQ